jgi:hypothetical protein
MLTDQEVRLRCFELAYQYCAKSIGGTELESLFEIAEKIYRFVSDTIGHGDEVDWDAYQAKLRENNRGIIIKKRL